MPAGRRRWPTNESCSVSCSTPLMIANADATTVRGAPFAHSCVAVVRSCAVKVSWYPLSIMTMNDYKTILYRQDDGSWVAEIPAISGCYALMPTREEALAELKGVFAMIAAESKEKGAPLPADTTELLHA